MPVTKTGAMRIKTMSKRPTTMSKVISDYTNKNNLELSDEVVSEISDQFGG